MFYIKQRVINKTNGKYDFYSYGQIIRNEIPDIIDFLILHEGLIANLDDELIEEDYDDIQEKKFTKTAQKGWLGISDKYWITSLIPPQNKEFKKKIKKIANPYYSSNSSLKIANFLLNTKYIKKRLLIKQFK